MSTALQALASTSTTLKSACRDGRPGVVGRCVPLLKQIRDDVAPKPVHLHCAALDIVKNGKPSSTSAGADRGTSAGDPQLCCLCALSDVGLHVLLPGNRRGVRPASGLSERVGIAGSVCAAKPGFSTAQPTPFKEQHFSTANPQLWTDLVRPRNVDFVAGGQSGRTERTRGTPQGCRSLRP